MSHSLGEVSALSIKAARGAGLSWGLAEEAGWAVRWLAARGLPGPEALTVLLSEQDGWSALEAGLALAETAGSGPTHFDALRAPLLIVPFLSRTIARGRVRAVTVGPRRFFVGADGTDAPAVLAHVAAVRIGSATGLLEPGGRTNRVNTVDPAAFRTLNAFASRTYAPATEASRRQGAGAGVTDND